MKLEIPTYILENNTLFEKTYDKMVLIALYHNNEASIPMLSNWCMCSENVIRQSIKRLEQHGLLKVEAVRRVDGSNAPNRHTILEAE